MLNRKQSKGASGSDRRGRGGQRVAPEKERRPRRRFIISSKAASRLEARAPEGHNGGGKPHAQTQPKAHAGSQPQGSTGAPPSAVDLAEMIKTLLHLDNENGHVTPGRSSTFRPTALATCPIIGRPGMFLPRLS